MQNVAIPLWAHAALMVAAFALIAFLEWRHDRTESALRRKLGACRTSLAACEILRDSYRRTMQGQSVELARYRGQLPPDLRVTEVFVGPDGKVG